MATSKNVDPQISVYFPLPFLWFTFRFCKMLISFCSKYNGYMTECQINLPLTGKKSTERPLFWPGLLQLLVKKTDWNLFFFFPFFRQTRLPYFPQGHCSEQDQCYSDKSTFNSLKTLSNDSTPSTLDQPLWNLLKSMCSFCPHTATRSSSSRPSHQLLVGLTAAAFRCCLIKHRCRNAELLGGLAEYADEVLHKNPITDWTQWPD